MVKLNVFEITGRIFSLSCFASIIDLKAAVSIFNVTTGTQKSTMAVTRSNVPYSSCERAMVYKGSRNTLIILVDWPARIISVFFAS
jgi:hypothetical protein